VLASAHNDTLSIGQLLRYTEAECYVVAMHESEVHSRVGVYAAAPPPISTMELPLVRIFSRPYAFRMSRIGGVACLSLASRHRAIRQIALLAVGEHCDPVSRGGLRIAPCDGYLTHPPQCTGSSGLS